MQSGAVLEISAQSRPVRTSDNSTMGSVVVPDLIVRVMCHLFRALEVGPGTYSWYTGLCTTIGCLPSISALTTPFRLEKRGRPWARGSAEAVRGVR